MPLINKYKKGKLQKAKKHRGHKSGAAAVEKTRSQGGRGTRPRSADGTMY